MSTSPADTKRLQDRRRMWSARLLVKYWLLQLPAIGLVLMILLAVEANLAWPRWVVWTLVAAWIAKDAILYPVLWRAYDLADPSALPYPMEGAIGVAVGRIDPSGLVRIWGELWRAELCAGARRIEPGETVQVTARRGLTLLVGPAPAS
ncbi:MAG TPA: NfeD family protein [Burkholderiales bacterium]|nr:NfeD family protein [Burkholderiales bacterium]